MKQASAAGQPPTAAAEVFAIRRMVAADLAFVTDSWLRSAWHTENTKLRATHNRRERERAGRAWFDAIRPRVTALIADRGTTVLVACDRPEPSHIAGWIAIREGREVRSHVKHAYRPWGVGELLRIAMEDEAVGDTPRRLEIR